MCIAWDIHRVRSHAYTYTMCLPMYSMYVIAETFLAQRGDRKVRYVYTIRMIYIRLYVCHVYSNYMRYVFICNSALCSKS